MKKFTFILTFIFAILVINLNAHAEHVVYVDNKALCERMKGNWRLFNNSCADSCEAKFESPLCTYHPSFTCDCGENRCWDGGKCIADRIAKADADEKIAKQKADRDKELTDAGIDPETGQAIAAPTSATVPIANQAPKAVVPNNPAPNNPPAKVVDNSQTPVKTAPPILGLDPKADTGNPFVAPGSLEAQALPLIDTITDGLKTAVQSPEMVKKTQERQQACEAQSGKWIQFKDGCADNCGAKIADVHMCTQVVTFSCSCGGTRCWDGSVNSCVELESFKKNLTIFKTK